MKKELEGYLDCGLLCRGFARVRCDGCEETRLVAFSCKGRGFCPSCLGRKMSATAAHLIEDVLPGGVPLRQWVLTFPFAWRKRLGYDAPLSARLTRIFVTTVLGFYRAAGVRAQCGQSGAVVSVQRTSSDLKLNPHLHAVFLEGAYRGADTSGEPKFESLGHISTRDVASVLERVRARMTKFLRRKGLLEESEEVAEAERTTSSAGEGLASLAASAATGTSPPAGPEWRRGGLPVVRRPMVLERPLCVALDGFTLHAATRAGGLDTEGREALLKYILRPAIAQERVTSGAEGLVRIALKRAFSDGTVAVDLDPLSLLSRLVAAVPAPRFHTVRYAGVLGSASKLRARIVPSRARQTVASEAPPEAPPEDPSDAAESPRRPRYRPWAELL
ncbi:MAG: transposase [Deltaproteobacteria bacterium]|nr:transposase [Deltaproteobacteria bacterium]